MLTRWPTICSVLVLLPSLPIIHAQSPSIFPSAPSSSFPACALDCPDLNAAASSCTQSNIGESQDVLNSCFCQRAEVVPFYEAPTGVCDTACSSDPDRSSLQSWFQGYCSASGFGDGSSGDGTATTLITSTRSPTSTATGVSGGGSGSSATSSQDGGWFANHWQWVLMLILLLLGLGALTFLAVFLKRRHKRKVERRRAALPEIQAESSASIGPDMWGPHQHMAHTGGWEYSSEQDQQMRDASEPTSGGVLGNAIVKAKNLKRGRNGRQGKKRSKEMRPPTRT